MSLHIAESGPVSGPAILFLHGLGVSSWMWHDQIAALQDDYRCLAVDLPGSGESYRQEWHSFAATADQLAELIKGRIPAGRTHIVGLSLGGYTALHLLQRHPEVVDDIVISGVTSRPFARAGLYRLLVPFMARAVKWDLVIGLSARLMQLPPEVRPLYRRDSKRVAVAGFKRIYDEVLDYELPPILAQRPQRLLVAAGAAEARPVLAQLGDLPALMSNAAACIAPDAHHGWNGEHPELFSAMIHAWIERQPLPAALQPLAPDRVRQPVRWD